MNQQGREVVVVEATAVRETLEGLITFRALEVQARQTLLARRREESETIKKLTN